MRLALRTQQIIAHETGVTNTIDPLGGSYFVEALTDRMEQAAYDYFRRIDELGGMVEAVKRNFPQREIADASWRYQEEVDEGRRAGRGRQPLPAGRRGAARDPAHRPGARAQADRPPAGDARAPRRGRGGDAALAALKEAAADPGRNLMDPLLDCARARCSEGEMVEALQSVFGSYTESPVF